MSQYCKQVLFRDWRQSRCSNLAKLDGYCIIHHPDNVKKREEAKIARWEEKAAQRMALVEAEQQMADRAAHFEEMRSLLKECHTNVNSTELKERVGALLRRIKKL